MVYPVELEFPYVCTRVVLDLVIQASYYLYTFLHISVAIYLEAESSSGVPCAQS